MGEKKKLPNVPRKEEEIEEFCRTFLEYLEENPTQKITRLLPTLESLRKLLYSFQKMKLKQELALERYQEVTTDKDAILDSLTKVLRQARKELQKADGETSEKIAVQMDFRNRQQILPGTPRNLRGHLGERGSIRLRWIKPKRGDGGIINHYEIMMCKEERNPGMDRRFEIIATTDSANTELLLEDLPTGEKLVFKIVSINHLGPSPDSSNELVIVL